MSKSKSSNKKVVNKDTKNSVFVTLKEKISSLFNSKDSQAVKNYKKMKNKKIKKKRLVNGKFQLDILDLILIIVGTVTVSCLFTGFILNYQYRKNIAYLNSNNVTSEYIVEFIDIYTEVVDNFYEEVDQKKMLKAALEGMMEFLEDNYSIYLNEDETSNLSETLEGSYKGIGIVALGNSVYSVYEGSPAEEAGLKVGDIIIEINGKEVNEKNYLEISEFLKNDKNNKIIVKRDKEVLTFNVKVSDVNVPSTNHDVIEKDGKRIGYIALSTFSRNSAEDFQNSLLEITKEKEIDSLIVDLRSNTGGYLKSATNITSIFLEKGKVIYNLEQKGKVTKYKDETKQSLKYPVVVLVNSGTASAGEVLAGALKDSYGATIVGKTTFGKGTVQSTKDYNGSMIKYTTAKWLRPNGECVDKKGIKPDYEVDLEVKNNTVYDKQLDKAIELLS